MRAAVYVRVSTSRQVKLQTTLNSSWKGCKSTLRRKDGTYCRRTSSETTATAGRPSNVPPSTPCATRRASERARGRQRVASALRGQG